MSQQDTHRLAVRPAEAKKVSAARIVAAAFGVGAGLLVSNMACSRPSKSAPFVLALILLPALAYDSQQSRAAQQTT
jgi:hypothetical protein